MTTNPGNDSSPPYSPILKSSPNHTSTDTITNRSRTSSGASGRLRRASLKFKESGPPLGAWHAAGEALGKAPTPNDIIKGKYSYDGWDGEVQRKLSMVDDEGARRLARTTSSSTTATPSRPSALHAHQEAEAEIETFPNILGRGEMKDQVFTRRPTQGDVDEEANLAPDTNTRRLPKILMNPPLAAKLDETSTAVRTDPRSSSSTPSIIQGPNADGVYPNGYKFPPKHSRAEAAKIGFKAFCRYFITIPGFLVVMYCLNIVAWGGMLFLLLIGGGDRYMCYPEYLHGIKSCSDQQSPRRIWIEIDSQILNALFCVTGLGLIPWRFRDLYYLLQWRLLGNQSGLRTLAGIHNGWFRLSGSDKLPINVLKPEDYPDLDDPALPTPSSKIPPGPLTGVRAPATKTWKLDYVIWAMVLNTFLQCVLCGFMWGYNRFNRPSWATGLFIALACLVAALGGLMTFQEAKKVKAVEGIPVEDDEEKSKKTTRDSEKGIEEEKKDIEEALHESKERKPTKPLRKPHP